MSENIRMYGNPRTNIMTAAQCLESEISGELVEQEVKTINGGKVILMVFEKYFFRNGGYGALTVMLTDDGKSKEAVIIGFGGGNGLLNISFGANSDFAEEAEEILRNNGFN